MAHKFLLAIILVFSPCQIVNMPLLQIVVRTLYVFILPSLLPPPSPPPPHTHTPTHTPPNPMQQDDEVSDILTRAMTGEIAVGSYQPLPSIGKDSSRVSTTPIPARSGRGGVIQRSVVTSGQPVSKKVRQAYHPEQADQPKKVDRLEQADHLERAEQHERPDHLEQAEQHERADRHGQAHRHKQADRPEKKDAIEVEDIVHAAKRTEEKWLLVEKEAKEEAGVQSHEDVLELEEESEKASYSAVEVVTRREKNKLRDLLSAIESYDR